MAIIRYRDVFTYENLYEEYQLASRGKRSRSHVIKYQQHAPTNILNLKWKLDHFSYNPKPDFKFYVYEPKKRLITANKFEDKIVQRALCTRVLMPTIGPRLIQDNYASQPKKGTHMGIQKLTKNLHSYWINYGIDGYILQCDIRKYFDNIDREKLLALLAKLPFDPKLLELQRKLIYHDNPDSPKGICIGYQCSQWYAVYYLSAMDHYIKEVLKIKYYGRYMDDFYLIHPDKEYLKYCLKEIKRIIGDLGLELNKKSSIYPIKNGITFLGFRQKLKKTGKVVVCVKKASRKRNKRRLKKLKKQYENGLIDYEGIEMSHDAYIAHISHGNCKGVIESANKFYQETMSEVYRRDENGFIKLEWN